MLRFFEPELVPDHRIPNRLRFAWESKVSEMRNDAVFPLLSSSLLSNNFAGNNESQARNFSISPRLERLNTYHRSFLWSSEACDSSQINTLSSPPSMNPIPGQASMASDLIDTKPTSLTSRCNVTTDIRKQRKHTLDQTSVRKNKRQKAVCDAKQQHPSSDESSQLLKTQGAAKKSQKLGDKITALQQLVSPFGKTDTASVLQEAGVCIKVLHEQIRVLSSPYFGLQPSPVLLGNEDMELGLWQRGLCLTSISPDIENLIERLEWEAGIHHLH